MRGAGRQGSTAKHEGKQGQGARSQRDMTGMVGTPNYMAPELMAMDQGSANGAIDVYCLASCCGPFTQASHRTRTETWICPVHFPQEKAGRPRAASGPNHLQLMVDAGPADAAAVVAEINERLRDLDGPVSVQATRER